MLELIIIILTAIYIIEIIAIHFGAGVKFPTIAFNDLPAASVIVAARNEENNIVDCLQSLDKLVYPDGKLQIIIVDDGSTDRTHALIEKFIEGKNKFTLIQAEEKISNLAGKAKAIASGIKTATGKIILTTDADCIVSPTWAAALAKYYSGDTAMVCGFTNQEENTLFKAFQSVDFLYLLKVGAGVMNLGLPISCIGNNMSYRRDVYEEVGGYESLPFSVTEDYNLLKAFNSLNKYEIIYPIDAEGLVSSKSCSTIKELYRQKKRWAVGGLDSDLISFAIMGSAFVLHLAMIISLFYFSLTVSAVYIAKFTADYFFLKSVHGKLHLKLKLINFIVFEIYFILYLSIIPFILIFSRKIYWKEREY